MSCVWAQMFQLGQLVFKRSSRGRVKVSSSVLAQLLDFLQVEKHSNEAGGLLLGRFIYESDDIVVDDITTPFPGDLRGRSCFIGRDPSHQDVLRKRWIQANGTINYLGEWHTHPERAPLLSYCDRLNMTRLVRETEFEGDSLLFLIAGTNCIRAWECCARGPEVAYLSGICIGGSSDVYRTELV